MTSNSSTNRKQSTRSAQTKRKTSSTNTRKGKTNRAVAKKKSKADFSEFYEEIIIIVTIAIMIFFMLSNFSLCGKIGKVVSKAMFGIFGGIQYILPILLFFGVALLVSNRYSSLAIKKVMLGAVSTLYVATLWQLIVDANVGELKQAYLYSANHHTGGGYLGAAISRFLYQYFGLAGAYVTIIALLLISLVLITERSFVDMVKKSGGEVAQNMIENGNAACKSLQEARAQRKILDRERKEEKRREEAKRKELVKDPELGKRTMVLPDKDILPHREIPTRTAKRKKEVKELQYEGCKIDAETGEILEEQKTTEKKKARKEPVFHFLQDLGEKEDSAVESKTAIVIKKTMGGLKEIVEEEKPDNPWDFALDKLPTEEELLLQGLHKKKDKDGEKKRSIIERPNQITPKEEKKREPIRKKQEKQEENREEKEEIKPEEIIIKPEKQGSAEKRKPYIFPPLTLLKQGKKTKGAESQNELRNTAMKLQQTLENFGVGVTITDVSQGPSVTRYELQPEQGVKVSKIVGLADDIKLNLAAADIRIEAPIPGKAAVGIEVPNKTNSTVMFRDLIDNEEFAKFPSDIAFAVGKDIGGKTIITDIAKMPHLLIAGATGSGKSVCINTLIMSILYKANPSDVKLIMIDPKVVELSTYNGIPHLLIPVVTDPKKASSALNWAVMEMTDRYKKFAEYNVRNLKGYNQKVEEVLFAEDTREDGALQKLPQIIIIVDELADLMMVAPGEVEDAIVRLSQLARAAGIHLVIATQRPSVNVITGLIKANVPSRIAFSVSSGVDSRTIIDMNGAEKLLGKGDMLFYPSGYQKPVRVQGAFISDKEVSDVVEFLKENSEEESAEHSLEIEEKINNSTSIEGSQKGSDRDDYFVEAAKFIIEKDKASIGMLQRMFKIGFNRAARIMDQLADAGVVGPEEGTKPRKVVMSEEEFENFLETEG